MTAACLMTTYQPLALSFTRGLGTRLWDQQGREYLDAVAGVAVTNVGHSHPRIVSAISGQPAPEMPETEYDRYTVIVLDAAGRARVFVSTY